MSLPLEFEKQLRGVIDQDPGGVFDVLVSEAGIDMIEEFCREEHRTPLEEHLWAVRASAAAQRVEVRA